MSKYFLYDFFSLKNARLEIWAESFFWPVSREETQNILLDLIDENKRMANELGNSFEGDCLVIYNQTWNPYIRIANYLLVLSRLKDMGYDPRFSHKSVMIEYLLSSGPFPVHKENFQLLIRENKCVRAIKDFLLSVRYNHRQNKYKVWNHFIGSKSIFVTPDINVLHVHSTKEQKKWMRITSPEEWLLGWQTTEVRSKELSAIHKQANLYHEYAIDYMSDKLGLEVSENVTKDLLSFHVGYLEDIAKLYQCICKNVSKKQPSKLFVGTGGKTFTRALSLAVRSLGGKVRGHPHGYFIGHSASHRPHHHEFSTVDEFSVYTESLKELFKRNTVKFPPPRNNQVTFVSQNSDELKRFRNVYKNDPIPKEIKSIMVLELQLWTDDIRYEIPETMINYHFYYNLCKTLTNNGYEVIFKKRPKSWGWENVDFFKDMPNVEVIYDSLEDPKVMNMADAIIFQYGLSSTFVPMMCSNKTLIYVDAGWEDWYPDVYELMKKRCSVLKCWNSENNQQNFDENNLLEILSQKPQEPNMEFFEKYLKPESVN
tara:strand:+ start:89 stop:1711 length:1623 start_codon:yes stop_codon:yes gene_type:complete